MSKVCTKCGCVIEDNAKFCEECGASVEDSSAQKIDMYSQKYERTANSYNTVGKKRRSGKKGIGIIALIFGIFSIITLGMYVLPEIVAIICGVFSKDECGKRTKVGNAGFVCGIIGSILFVIMLVLVLFWG